MNRTVLKTRILQGYILRLGAAVVIATCMAATNVNANLLTNGSLSGPLGLGTVPAGWSVLAGSPDTNDIDNNVAGAALYAVAPLPSPDGGTWVGFARDDASAGFFESFGQTVGGLSIGAEYTLSWFAGNFGADSGLNYTAPNAIEVLLDGGSIGSGAILPLGENWYAESIMFTATAASHDIAFRLLDGARSYLSIDGISLTAVPEPTTLAILGLGLAGLGIARRRKAA